MLAALLAVGAGIMFQPMQAGAASAQAASGAELFTQHCASCHQAGGLGVEGTFPPLAGNPAASDQQYVESVILNGLSGPIEVLGVQYDAVMPPAAALTDPAEIEQLVQYVAELASAGAGDQGDGSADPEAAEDSSADGPATDEGTTDEATTDEAAGPVIGDADRGHDLFLGAARLDAGGAACVGCHTAGSVGNLGGPGLGPDLTGAFDTLGGEAGLVGWLANPPSPTMQPLFADRPLTEAEIADLVAFLGAATEQEKSGSTVDLLSVFGFGGLAVLIAGMALAWRGMRQTYVERLRSGHRGKRMVAGRGSPLSTSARERPPVAAQRQRSSQ